MLRRIAALWLLSAVAFGENEWREFGGPQCPPASSAALQRLRADVAVMLDTSSQMGAGGYASVVNFLSQSLLPSLNVSASASHLALLNFGAYVQVLGDFQTPASLLVFQSLLSMAKLSYFSLSASSNMAAPLHQVVGLQSPARGRRPGVPAFLIIFTAANPSNLADASVAAAALREAGTTIIAVGVGRDVYYRSLASLASPGAQNVLTAANPLRGSSWGSMAAEIGSALLCGVPAAAPTQATPPPPITYRPPDRPIPAWLPVSQLNQIIDYLTTGAGAGQTYDWLANIVDTFGNRVVTGPTLNRTVDYLIQTLTKQGFDNVHWEAVTGINDWKRGVETATLRTPRQHSMSILGIAGSPPTPGGQPLTAPVVVVRSFDELRAKGAAGLIRGRIVVYNQDWTTYGGGYAFRANGGLEAAKYGAVAALVRSVTPFSIYSPHTGFGHGGPIPTACVTVEDAELMWRFQQRGQAMTATLQMTSHSTGNSVVARDTVFEIRGSEKPQEIILLSGHLDSWDVGTGAMDDGGGCAAAWGALYAIKSLGLRPKRTIRAVFWGSEERGPGGDAYHARHSKMPNERHVFVSESDMGAFRGRNRVNASLYFWGNDVYYQGLTTAQLLVVVGDVAEAKGVYFGVRQDYGPDGGDVSEWEKDGVPGAFYMNMDQYEYYFNFHHTNGDTMTVLKPDDLDYTAAMFAASAWAIANA